MNDNDATTTTRANRPGRARTIAIVAMMIVAWLGVVLGRNHIRAYWWTSQLLNTEDAAVQSRLCLYLTSLGSPALRPAARLMTSDDARDRVCAAGVFGEVSSDYGSAKLVQMVADSESVVRHVAVAGLANQTLSDDNAAKLEALLRGDDASSGMSAIVALGDANRFDPIANALAAVYAIGVRAQAMETLGSRNATETVSQLVEYLGDETVFSGLTEGESFYRGVSAMLGGKDAPSIRTGRTLGEHAYEALSKITGEQVSYDPSDPDSIRVARERFVAWMNANDP
jgi:HEAT repeat protein